MEQATCNKTIVHPAAIEAMVNKTFQAGRIMLWEEYELTQSQQSFVKNCLREYYQRIPAEQFSIEAENQLRNFVKDLKPLYRWAHRLGKDDFHPCRWLVKKYGLGISRQLSHEPGGFTAA